MPCFTYALSIRENWFQLLADSCDLPDDASKNTAFMGTPVTPSDGAGGKLRYPPPYSVEEFIPLHIPKMDAR